MKDGAYDYVTKPFSMEELRLLLERVAGHLRLKTESRVLRETIKSRQGFGNIIGRARATEAAHVGRNRAKSRRRERNELMPPRIPDLRPAMAHQHQRPFAVFGDVHLDPVHRDGAEAEFKRRHAYRPGRTSSFGFAGSVCFDKTTDGTSASSTSHVCRMRETNRSSV